MTKPKATKARKARAPKISQAASPAIAMLEGLRRKGTPKSTLKDHILRNLKPNTYFYLRSLMNYASRELSTGKYNDLIGTVIFPTRMSKAAWAVGVPTMENLIPEPIWSTTSTEMVLLHSHMTSMDPAISNDPNYHASLKTISKLPMRAYKATVFVTERLAVLAEEKNMQIASLQETVQQHTAALSRIQQQIGFLGSPASEPREAISA